MVAGQWEDKLAIRETLERYMRYNDDGALDRLVALFAEDAVLQVMGRVLRGHEQIRAFLGAGGVFVDGRPQWTDPGQLLLAAAARTSTPTPSSTSTAAPDRETDFAVLQQRGDGSCACRPGTGGTAVSSEDADGQWVFVDFSEGVSLARPGEAAPTASGNVRWRAPARPWSRSDMELSPEEAEFLASHKWAVLSTGRRTGRPSRR